MSRHKFICVGVISSAHGVRGGLKVKSFTEIPESIFDFAELFDAKGNAIPLRPNGLAGNALLATIKGIEDRNAAEALKGTKLYINRDQLPAAEEGEFYIEDLMGLTVKIADGREVGTVKQVANYGAGDVIEIAFHNGSEEMFLFNDDTFPAVDIQNGWLQLTTPEVLEAKKK